MNVNVDDLCLVIGRQTVEITMLGQQLAAAQERLKQLTEALAAKPAAAPAEAPPEEVVVEAA